jgi:hypothetical protein
MSSVNRLTIAIVVLGGLAWLAAYYSVHGAWVSAGFGGLGGLLGRWGSEGRLGRSKDTITKCDP